MVMDVLNLLDFGGFILRFITCILSTNLIPV